MTLLLALAVLGILVFVHELGHFLAARAFGFAVEEFALGFGPALVSRRWGRTVYSLRLIPLGGFVRLPGLSNLGEGRSPGRTPAGAGGAGGAEAPAGLPPGDFRAKPRWQRMLVVAAGPLMNFLLAILLFSWIYAVPVPTTIVSVQPNSPAAAAGFQPGDVVQRVDGQPVSQPEDLVTYLKSHPDQAVTVTVKRHGEAVTLKVVPRFDPQRGAPTIGVGIAGRPALGPLEALGRGVAETVAAAGMLFVAVLRMLGGLVPPDIAGPIGIVQIVGESSQHGWSAVMWLAGMLSVNLGLFNLFPIPVLDGGWLAILSVEALRGRPLTPQEQGWAQAVGGTLLLLLLLFATYRDVLRLAPS